MHRLTGAVALVITGSARSFALMVVTQKPKLGKDKFNAPVMWISDDFPFCLLLADAVMKIIPLSIPTPFYVGDVNVYLIKEDPVTLIDVGPKTPDGQGLARQARCERRFVFGCSPNRPDPRSRRSLRPCKASSGRIKERRNTCS